MHFSVHFVVGRCLQSFNIKMILVQSTISFPQTYRDSHMAIIFHRKPCIPRGLVVYVIKCKNSSNAWRKVGHNWHRQAWQRAWKQRPWLCSPHSPWYSHVFQASSLIDNSCFIRGNKISSESAKIRAFLTEGWQEDGIVVPFPGNYMYPAFIRGLCDILSRG